MREQSREAEQMMNLTIINRASGSVTVHKAGCRDVQRTMNAERPFAHAFTEQHETQWSAWYEYNADFLAEGSGAYPLDFMPCTKGLPEGDEMNEEQWSQ